MARVYERREPGAARRGRPRPVAARRDDGPRRGSTWRRRAAPPALRAPPLGGSDLRAPDPLGRGVGGRLSAFDPVAGAPRRSAATARRRARRPPRSSRRRAWRRARPSRRPRPRARPPWPRCRARPGPRGHVDLVDHLLELGEPLAGLGDGDARLRLGGRAGVAREPARLPARAAGAARRSSIGLLLCWSVYSPSRREIRPRAVASGLIRPDAPSQEALRVDVDRPRRPRVAAEHGQRVGPREHDVEAPASAAARARRRAPARRP